MRAISILLATAAFCAAPLSARADWIARQAPLADLRLSTSSAFETYNASVLSVTGTSPVTTLSFTGYRSSFGQTFSTAKDWSPYNIVHITLKNREARPLVFKFIVQVRPGENDYTGAYTGEFAIGSNQTREYCFYLNVDNPHPFGMEYLNPVLRATYTGVFNGSTFRDLRAVYHWRISSQETLACKVDLSDVRLIRQSLTFNGLVDKYGQYSDRNWTGKVYADSDFGARKASELNDLAAYPGKGEQQGTSSLVNPAPVPNKWAVVTYGNGRKFLQHPNGKLFWSFGLSGVNDSLATIVEDRENFFQALPSTTGRFASAYGSISTSTGTKVGYSFRRQNLMLKYGDSYVPSWVSHVKKRLASWGVNTLGIDTNKDFLNSSVPFTLALSTNGFPTRLKPPIVKWNSLPDPYSSTFGSWTTSRFTTDLSAYKGSSNLMGAFVDNEMSWGDMDTNAERYNIALGALAAPSTQPAKVAFVNRLKAKYSAVSSLNSAWGTTFSSYDAILQGRTWKPTTYNASIHADFQGFAYAFAAKYFGQVRSSLTAAGLKSLYLGCRFAGYTTEVVNAAGASADILSYNLYKYSPDVSWAYLNSRAKPVLISEFGFGLQSMGTFGGPAPVAHPAERAWRQREFLNAALSMSNVVGAHSYCYADQPITGRYTDGENAGIGIIDVADTPYGDTVSTFRTFSNGMYATRSSSASGPGTSP